MADEFDTPDAEGITRDRWGRYVLPDPRTGAKTPYTRCTTLAKGVDDTYLLDLWQKRNVVWGMATRPDLVAMAAGSAGLKDRARLNEVAEKAAEAAGAGTRARLGTALHKFCEQHDQGLPVTCPAALAPELAAYRKLVLDYGFEFLEIEPVVLNTRISTAGKPDRIVRLTRDIYFKISKTKTIHLYKGQIMILDLKTGSSLDFGGGSIAAQLAVYAQAEYIWNVGMWGTATKAYRSMPRLDLERALVIHLPVRESEDQPAAASLRLVDIQAGWDAAKLAYEIRAWRSSHSKSVISSADSVVAGIPAGQVEIDGQTYTRADLLHAMANGPDEVADGAIESLAELDNRNGTLLREVPTEGHDMPQLEQPAWKTSEVKEQVPPESTCFTCGRKAKNGKLTHMRGCIGAAPRRAAVTWRVLPCTGCGAEVETTDTTITEVVCATCSAKPVTPDQRQEPTSEHRCLQCDRKIRDTPGDLCQECSAVVFGKRSPAGHCAMCGTEQEHDRICGTCDQANRYLAALGDGKWAEAIGYAATRADLSMVWQHANRKGEWTDTIKEAGLMRLRELGVQ